MKKSHGKATLKNNLVLPERLVEIDLLKGMAIIAVILIHTWSAAVLLSIGAPFHIYHAVPFLLLIAGFTGTYSYMRHNATSLRECYDTVLLRRRFKRLFKPYILMFIIQIIILFGLFRYPFDLGSVLMEFITGGYGLGAYFVPVIIQSVIIVPILYLLAMRNPNAMLITAFIFNIITEILSISSVIPPGVYSILYVRFLFAGALGIWLALSPRHMTLWTGVLGMLSAIYIGIMFYTQEFSRFFVTNIGVGINQTPAFFWTYILALLGFLYLPKKSGSSIYRGLENAGKASWHIFLIQMTFFSLWQPLNSGVLTPVYYLFPPVFSFIGLIIIASVTIAICTGTGYLWYTYESAG